jgi:hypothetical protein
LNDGPGPPGVIHRVQTRPVTTTKGGTMLATITLIDLVWVLVVLAIIAVIFWLAKRA